MDDRRSRKQKRDQAKAQKIDRHLVDDPLGLRVQRRKPVDVLTGNSGGGLLSKELGAFRIRRIATELLGQLRPGQSIDVDTLLSLSKCLDELAAADPRRAQVFEYRFFLGLSVDEVAELLDISRATVKRDWSLAAAWLRLRWQD